MTKKIDRKKKTATFNSNNISTDDNTRGDRIRCIHHMVLPFKDFGYCNNESHRRYMKPVFDHECQYETLRPYPFHCYRHKFPDISVYKNSILQLNNVTRMLTDTMSKILLSPKNKALNKWKTATRVYLKDQLYRDSMETGEQNGKSIVTSVYFHASKVLDLLNEDTAYAFDRVLRCGEIRVRDMAFPEKFDSGSFKAMGFSMKQYKDRKAIHWKLFLNNDVIADTKDGKMFG